MTLHQTISQIFLLTTTVFIVASCTTTRTEKIQPVVLGLDVEVACINKTGLSESFIEDCGLIASGKLPVGRNDTVTISHPFGAPSTLSCSTKIQTTTASYKKTRSDVGSKPKLSRSSKWSFSKPFYRIETGLIVGCDHNRNHIFVMDKNYKSIRLFDPPENRGKTKFYNFFMDLGVYLAVTRGEQRYLFDVSRSHQRLVFAWH